MTSGLDDAIPVVQVLTAHGVQQARELRLKSTGIFAEIFAFIDVFHQRRILFSR